MHVHYLFGHRTRVSQGFLNPPPTSWCLKGPRRKFDYNRDQEYIYYYTYIRFDGIFVKIKFFLSRRLLHTIQYGGDPIPAISHNPKTRPLGDFPNCLP